VVEAAVRWSLLPLRQPSEKQPMTGEALNFGAEVQVQVELRLVEVQVQVELRLVEVPVLVRA